jgi:sortase A
MSKQKSKQDLSIDELRWLLVEKQRAARQSRLERFRQSGRVVTLAYDLDNPTVESWRSKTLLEDKAETAKPSAGKRILDGFLLLIEISAVAGFLYILFSGLNVIQELNREVAAMIQQPTLTPTALIGAVVLPSGHTSPNSPGGAQFNESEIPEHLRPMVQSSSYAPIPTSSPAQATRLQLPAIQVDAPIVQGDGWEQLKKGVGQHPGSVNPGENGNLVLSAHNDIFGEIFRYLDKLNPGDLVIVHTYQRSYTYIVIDTKFVDPDEVSVMEQTPQATITLISCYPYLKDNKRIVVIARLQTSG